MSNLASFSLINEKVQKIWNDENPDKLGTAFMMFFLRSIFRLTDEEMYEAITDGGMDGEVDSIYIDKRTINILTFKYSDNFDNTKKNYPATELDQFTLTVDSIINGTLLEETINDAVWEKYQEIRSLATTGKIEFRLYVVSNKLHPVEHAKTKLNSVIEKYKIVEKPIYFNQEELVTKLLDNNKEKVDGEIRFIEKRHFEKSDGNIKTVIGVVPANDIIQLIQDKDNPLDINEDVFNENVRVYKPKHRVNKAIVDSAKSESNYQFFYLNNGITILCEEIDYSPFTSSPVVPLKNLQIINGGQTSHSLFKVHLSEPEKINNIEVLVRVCETKKNDPITEKISETSNNQIPIGNRDLHSNDNIQKKLQNQFDTLGYYYERKPNQYDDKPKAKVLNNEILGQLFMAYHLEMPSEAKNSKTKVFGELYDDIFNEDIIEAGELLRLFKLYKPLLEIKKEIQKKKRRKENIDEKSSFKSRAIFHIIYGTKILFDKEVNDILNGQGNAKEKRQKLDSLYEEKSELYVQKSIDIIYELVKSEMKMRGDLYTHDKFFKEIPTNVMVRNEIKKNQ